MERTSTPGSQNSNTITIVLQFVDYIAVYVTIVFIIFGIFGNFLSVIIFFRKYRQDRVSAQYLCPLAVSDFLNLSTIGLPLWLSNHIEDVTQGKLIVNTVYDATTDLQCKVFVYFYSWLGFISSWIITIFSIERVYVIWFPLRASTITDFVKKRATALVCIFIIPAITSLSMFYFGGVQIMEIDRPDRIHCLWFSNSTHIEKISMGLILLPLNMNIPIVIITVSNILLLVGLRRSKLNHGAKSGGKDTTSKADIRIIKNLMLISFFYVIFTLPYCIIWPLYIEFGLTDFSGQTSADVSMFGRLAKFSAALLQCNYAVNPAIYVLGYRFYRTEAKRILFCGLCSVKTDNNKTVSAANRK